MLNSHLAFLHLWSPLTPFDGARWVSDDVSTFCQKQADQSSAIMQVIISMGAWWWIWKVGQFTVTLNSTKLERFIIESTNIDMFNSPPAKTCTTFYKIELHILFCHFFWPYSVVIDERRFRQFLAVTSRKWQDGAFSGGRLLKLTPKNVGRKKFDAVLAAAPNLGQLKPPTLQPWNKEKAKLHFYPKPWSYTPLLTWTGRASEDNNNRKSIQEFDKKNSHGNDNLVLPIYMLWVIQIHTY